MRGSSRSANAIPLCRPGEEPMGFSYWPNPGVLASRSTAVIRATPDPSCST